MHDPLLGHVAESAPRRGFIVYRADVTLRLSYIGSSVRTGSPTRIDVVGIAGTGDHDGIGLPIEFATIGTDSPQSRNRLIVRAKHFESSAGTDASDGGEIEEPVTERPERSS